MERGTLVRWDNTNGWMESGVKVDEDGFHVGEIYFENENYSLRAHKKDNDYFYLVAEWKI